MNSELSTLRSAICDSAAQARDLRAQSLTVSGMDRWSLQHQARELGFNTRDMLLAYGFLRGKSLTGLRGMEPETTRCPADESAVINLACHYLHRDPLLTDDVAFSQAKIALKDRIKAQFADQRRIIALRALGLNKQVA